MNDISSRQPFILRHLHLSGDTEVVQEMRPKSWRMDCMELNSPFRVKKTVGRVMRHPKNEIKPLPTVHHLVDRCWYLKCANCKMKTRNLNVLKIKLISWTESSQEKHEWLIKHERKFNILCHQRNANSNYFEIPCVTEKWATTHSTENREAGLIVSVRWSLALKGQTFPNKSFSHMNESRLHD